MAWNGLNLVNNFSAELGDTTTAYKTKVLGYINDGIQDLSTSHRWAQLREKGKAVLLSGLENHSIVHSAPIAPTVALASGGSLTEASEYKFLVTFYESQAEVESIAGAVSTGITPTTGNQTADLSAIPISANPLVTARKIYLSKAGGAYFYHSTIADNIATTLSITSDPPGQVTAPAKNYIDIIDGDLFIEGSRILGGVSLQDFTFKTATSNSIGTPSLWSPVNEGEVVVYPKPSADTIVSFYYFKKPAQVFGTTTSIPQLPEFLFDDLRRYVMWRGYDFRDRAGKESKEITYRENLKLTILRKGGALKKSLTVRRVTPDSDGMV